jgi:hypothetical protein
VGVARRIEDVWTDPERRAKVLQTFWLMSVGMLAFGYLVIARYYWGRLPLWP